MIQDKFLKAEEVEKIMLEKAMKTLPHGIIPKFFDWIENSRLMKLLYWGD